MYAAYILDKKTDFNGKKRFWEDLKHIIKVLQFHYNGLLFLNRDPINLASHKGLSNHRQVSENFPNHLP